MEIPPSRVLLIDDDEDEYAVIREMLAETGATKYDLDWAGTYNDGLKAISQSKYDVVLIDYRLGEKKWTGIAQSNNWRRHEGDGHSPDRPGRIPGRP